MKTKKCFQCGKRKRLDKFYKHPKMKDGYLKQCKDCKKETVRNHRIENIDKIQEYDRKRGQTEKRKKRNRDNSRNNREKANARQRRYYEKNREKIRESGRKWAQRNREKRACHYLVQGAIESGRLVRQPCEECGVESDIHAHHEDYFKPLEVVWLCIKCHNKRHRKYKD